MTASQAPLDDGRVLITREGLRDGSLLARVRANLQPGMVVRSDAEIEASLDAMLARCDAGADVWLFAYGSLMWNPAFHYGETRPGLLRGWHRRFCLWMRSGRGSPHQPGLMLALDRGGACHGLVFRIQAPAREELLLVWRREMFGQAYAARWVRVLTREGVVPAIAFVVNRRFERYAGALADEVVAERLATAGGALGTCGEYLDFTIGRLRTFGLRDRGLERLEAMVRGRAVVAGAGGGAPLAAGSAEVPGKRR